MSRRRQRSPEELKAARKLVWYEMEMLHAAVRAFTDGPWDRKNPCLKSIFVDSALLHARNLHDFLNKPKKPEDWQILAVDYIRQTMPGTSWQPRGFSLTRNVYKRICEYRSHLSYKRLPNRQKVDWSAVLAEIGAEIDRAFAEFIAVLPKSEQSEWEKGELKGHRADFRESWLDRSRRTSI